MRDTEHTAVDQPGRYSGRTIPVFGRGRRTDREGARILITKGALDNVLQTCSSILYADADCPLDESKRLEGLQKALEGKFVNQGAKK